MAHEHATARYRKLYAKLLRLYPKQYRERFAEGMEQTFNDLCRERTRAGDGLFTFALWTFGETFFGIVRENITFITLLFMSYKNLLMHSKNIIRIALVVAFLLLIPLVAMQFFGDVVWSVFDFALAGTLLFGAGLTFELVARKAGNTAHRFAVGLAVTAALLLIWVNLAVGLIGNENNPLNLLYGGVLAIGFIGAIIARLEPQGMSRVMFITAIAQVLVPVIALMIGRPRMSSQEEIMGVVTTFGASAFFAMPFIGSALLFRKAAPKQPIAVAGSQG